MALQRETREQWGARPPRHRRYDVTPKGVAVHYPGADAQFRAMTHDQHQALLRQWQAQHMARDSNDLEYGSLICPCGIWMEGRTEFDNPMVRVGSNGNAAANRDYTSVQLMLGNAEPITDREVQWLGEAIAWLRGEGWGPKIVGHRDLSSTACPGDSIYQALPRIKAAAANPQQQQPQPKGRSDMILISRKSDGAVFLLGLSGPAILTNGADIPELQKALSDPTYIASIDDGSFARLAAHAPLTALS